MDDGATDRPVRISGSEWKNGEDLSRPKKGIDIFTKHLDMRAEAWKKHHQLAPEGYKSDFLKSALET